MHTQSFEVRRQITSDQRYQPPLEKRLRALLANIRTHLGAALMITKELVIPEIIDTPTNVTIFFEDDPGENVASFLTYQDAKGEVKRFFVPQLWTAVMPQGNISFSTAVTILENFHLKLAYANSVFLRFEGMFSGEDTIAHQPTWTAGAAYETTQRSSV